MQVVLLGPPGSGKGTQAAKISVRFRIPHIATGDLFRKHADADDELGRHAKMYMNRGELVPDEIVLDMFEKRFSDPDCNQGFVLDGFPRTVPQAEALDRLLDARGMHLDVVIDIKVADDQIVRRLSGRRVCAKCGEIFHLEIRPPRKSGICDRCGEQLSHRADDQPETIRSRLTVYHQGTEPVIEFYQTRGLLEVVDGEQPPDQVTEQILQALNKSIESSKT